MKKKCECQGPVCSCGAEGVVKDGAGVRVQLSTMDEAPKTGGPNLVGDSGEAWNKAVFDQAQVPMKGANDNSENVPDPTSVSDVSDAWATALEDHNKRR